MKKSLLIISTVVLVGCNGVKFASAPINKALPETFTKRAIYPAGVAGYEFQDLVGNILKVEADKDPIRIGVIRPSAYKSAVIPITDANNYYKSRIQKSADAEVNTGYLKFAASFSADKMAELTLIDIARAGITLNDANTFKEILDSATNWVKKHPKGAGEYDRLWIKSVVLTRRVYQDFTKIEADASGQKGDVVGVKTGVYNKDENTIKSVIIAFEAFNIDELVASVNDGDNEALAPFVKGNDENKELKIDDVNSALKSIDNSMHTGRILGEIKLD